MAGRAIRVARRIWSMFFIFGFLGLMLQIACPASCLKGKTGIRELGQGYLPA